jgi:flagellar biogenesis protein FliO
MISLIPSFLTAVALANGGVIIRPQGVVAQPAASAATSLAVSTAGAANINSGPVTSAHFEQALQEAAQSLKNTEAVDTVSAAQPITSAISVPVGSTSESTIGTEDQPLGFAQVAAADNAVPLELSSKANTRGPLSFTYMAVVAGFLAVMGIGGIFVVRQWSTGKAAGKSRARINVVAQHSLGNKRSLMIVHVAGESLLLGVTDQNISLIKGLSLIDDEVPEALPSSFGRAMRDAVSPETDDFAAGQLGELRGLVSGKLKGLRNLA